MVSRSASLCTRAESLEPRNGGCVTFRAASADDVLLPFENPELVQLVESRELGIHALRLR